MSEYIPDDGSTGYAESFADVSDWTAGSAETTWTTDGDVATGVGDWNGGTDYIKAWSDGPSLGAGFYYLEYRYKYNDTPDATGNVRLYASDGQADYIDDWPLPASTSWVTKRHAVTAASGIECINFYAVMTTKDLEIDFEYIRISEGDECGWQHDGSTTAGTDDNGNAAWTYGASSDDDILTITQTRTGSGTSWSNFKILFDTTTTSADIEQDYYPFFAIRWRCTTLTTENVYLVIYSDGEKYDGLFLTTSTFGWTISYYNLKGVTGSADSNKYIRVASKGDAVDEQSVVEVDWTKMFSIANFTLTQSGMGADDYLHVDSGILHSHVDSGHIKLGHDPALSVAQASYPVYNLTTSGTAPEFAQWVSSWSTYSDDTRGATTSGTVTDIKLKFDSTETLSALKFIEDGTAPLIVRSSANPPGPDDDEGVVLKAVVDDAVEVYSVKFNAIVYPDGFSDVDYDATEQTDNLWMYSFSSLDAGNYTFKVIASDGANENALTEYAYIDFVVREAVIIVEEITLIGAGEDFSMMTFSARINKDCSYTIYEESASSAESDTHTGSVTEPSFNLAWTKLDVDDANVNFTIKFTSGSLTYNYTSQYQVAQTTFYVDAGQVEGLDTVTVAGRISKLGAWQLYDDQDTFKDSGSITDLDFTIRFTKWSGYDEQDHDFAIKFTNGSQNCWYNSSFYAFKKAVVAPPNIPDPNIIYAFQVSFWTLIAVLAVGGMVIVQGKEKISK